MRDTDKKNESELRRWVSNLQLESWQLELLITGFSIFLLATSLEQYDSFESSFVLTNSVGKERTPFLPFLLG